MPFKDREERNRYQRELMRKRRAMERVSTKRKRLRNRAVQVKRHVEAVEVEGFKPQDIKQNPADVLANWCTQRLRVPDGPLMGKPFRIDPWQLEFLRGALAPEIREAGLSVARKNGKSGLIAALILGFLVGPLNKPQWRAAVASLTGELASELFRAVQLTAEVSMIAEIDVRKTPRPGRIFGKLGSRIDFLNADRASGHARGGDMSIIDECGLLQERHRGLYNAMFSSLSGRNGRLIAISIRGDSPMFNELAARENEPTVFWQEHCAPEDCELDDIEAWHLANPGLASGIKSMAYMKDASRKAILAPADQAEFKAHDLNHPQDPSRELIVTLAQWKKCVVDELPPRRGPCYIGIDLGGSVSMTAASVYWPVTGRLEVQGAFPDTPNLKKRGEADAVGNRYLQMEVRGELRTYPGLVTPVNEFLSDLLRGLRGQRIAAIVADRYRKAEVLSLLQEAGITKPVSWHSMDWQGSSECIRRFQKAIIKRIVAVEESLIMPSAISDSSLATDANGNHKLDKSRSRGRIDALQSAVLAVAEGEKHRPNSTRKPGVAIA